MYWHDVLRLNRNLVLTRLRSEIQLGTEFWKWKPSGLKYFIVTPHLFIRQNLARKELRLSEMNITIFFENIFRRPYTMAGVLADGWSMQPNRLRDGLSSKTFKDPCSLSSTVLYYTYKIQRKNTRDSTVFYCDTCAPNRLTSAITVFNGD